MTLPPLVCVLGNVYRGLNLFSRNINGLTLT